MPVRAVLLTEGASMSRFIVVWDPLVRFIHWLVLASFVVAYLTAGEAMQAHVISGYIVAGAVIVRVIWGFVGPRRARFADFVRGPKAALGYLISLLRGAAPRYLGHSPAGGLMAVALIAMLVAVTVTGMAMLADMRGGGPLSAIIPQGYTTGIPAPVTASGRTGGEESAFEEPHELLVNLMLLLVALHLMGVVLASRAHHENLPLAMITGRKRLDGDVADP